VKVIQQLIAHFQERGKLTPRHLQELAEKGYWSLLTAADLPSREGNIGESYFFQATGDVHGPLWGTDIYTSDSSLGTACVHAGLLRPGEAGVVKVTMVTPLPFFQGTTRNGVRSGDWTSGWSGAYTVELIGK
jgi:hypothetical protein